MNYLTLGTMNEEQGKKWTMTQELNMQLLLFVAVLSCSVNVPYVILLIHVTIILLSLNMVRLTGNTVPGPVNQEPKKFN